MDNKHELVEDGGTVATTFTTHEGVVVVDMT